MYLLPKEHPATKKILESPTIIPCDIYTENHDDCVKQQIEDFMRFVETHLNKLRKNHNRTTRVSVWEFERSRDTYTLKLIITYIHVNNVTKCMQFTKSSTHLNSLI